MNPFARSGIGRSLDALGQRYGIRPSSFLCMDPRSGRSLLFDLAIMSEALRAEAEAQTTAGQIRQKRLSWDPEIKEELRRMRMKNVN